MDILNYLQVNDGLATSGQPRAEQFAEIANLEYRTVINLALPTSDDAIAHEGELVTAQDMNYIHIPVIWEKPELSQYQLFCVVMEAHKPFKVWVHCAKNMRVSCFVALYGMKYLGFSDKEAASLISKIWQPNEVWSQFMSLAQSKNSH
ncbi:Beta-lactamase hydrolase-family protein [[Leptolyngbya] sp. PCC 7376]|uniref:protein tyrosine phosphatase family protein n=1 Tax=[Leptolyngbya] sp. PCC 7376 TaxID=111781 RepID=UPI00029F3E4E|nr:protein tyrosine phosphatase family protein [[Leptolyngbya] sp. PCC 7376]AFY36805.1 Beta-lactamase hydrolase-family protein [[Leptolyngbya] sp. PCC 7376]